MHFAHDVQVRTQGDDDGVVQGLAVDGERRGVVDVIGAGGAVLDAVDDFLLRLEFHQGCAVVFAQFGKGGAHVTDQLGIVVLKLVELSGGTVAKQLLLGLDLLVHFQSRHEAYAVIVFLCGFLALDVAGLLLGQLVVGAWVKVGAHIS